jgi:hypothetical protein
MGIGEECLLMDRLVRVACLRGIERRKLGVEVVVVVEGDGGDDD